MYVSDYQVAIQLCALNKQFFSNKGDFNNNLILIANEQIINELTEVTTLLHLINATLN